MPIKFPEMSGTYLFVLACDQLASKIHSLNSEALNMMCLKHYLNHMSNYQKQFFIRPRSDGKVTVLTLMLTIAILMLLWLQSQTLVQHLAQVRRKNVIVQSTIMQHFVSRTCCMTGRMQNVRQQKEIEMCFSKKFSKCDRWIGFVDALLRGKKNNHDAHDAFLNNIVDFFRNHTNVNSHRLKYRTIHADDCGAQQKCRNNFLKLIKNSQTYQCTYMYKFAQKHGLKGAWDGTRKLLRM